MFTALCLNVNADFLHHGDSKGMDAAGVRAGAKYLKISSPKVTQKTLSHL